MGGYSGKRIVGRALRTIEVTSEASGGQDHDPGDVKGAPQPSRLGYPHLRVVYENGADRIWYLYAPW